jgi:hypothetical protein
MEWPHYPTNKDYPELVSFAKDPSASVKVVLSQTHLSSNFHLPLSLEAHQQFLALEERITGIQQSQESQIFGLSVGVTLYSRPQRFILVTCAFCKD